MINGERFCEWTYQGCEDADQRLLLRQGPGTETQTLDHGPLGTRMSEYAQECFDLVESLQVKMWSLPAESTQREYIKEDGA